MKILIEFLRANPVVGLILAILLVCIVIFIMKKVFKIALILVLIFLVASGTLFRISHLQVAKKGEEFLKSTQSKVTTKVRQYLPGFDSASTDTASLAKAVKKEQHKSTTKK